MIAEESSFVETKHTKDLVDGKELYLMLASMDLIKDGWVMLVIALMNGQFLIMVLKEKMVNSIINESYQLSRRERFAYGRGIYKLLILIQLLLDSMLI